MMDFMPQAHLFRIHNLLGRKLTKKRLYKLKTDSGYLVAPMVTNFIPQKVSLEFSIHNCVKVNEEGYLITWSEGQFQVYQIGEDYKYKEILNFSIPDLRVNKLKFFKDFVFIGGNANRDPFTADSFSEKEDVLKFFNFKNFKGISDICIPRELFEKDFIDEFKGIYELFIEKNNLFAVGNFISETCIIKYNITDMKNIRCLETKKMPIPGYRVTIKQGYKNKNYFAFRNYVFNPHSLNFPEGISLISKDMQYIAYIPKWVLTLGVTKEYKKTEIEEHKKFSIPYVDFYMNEENLFLLLNSGLIAFLSLTSIQKRFEREQKTVKISNEDFRYVSLVDKKDIKFLPIGEKLFVAYGASAGEGTSGFLVEEIDNLFSRAEQKEISVVIGWSYAIK